MHPWNHRQNDDEQLDFGALYFQLFSDKAIVCFQTFCHVQTIFQFQNKPLIALNLHFERPVIGIASGELRHLIKPDCTGYTADQEMMGNSPTF